MKAFVRQSLLRLSKKLAQKAASHELFEKPGERIPQPLLAPLAAVAPLKPPAVGAKLCPATEIQQFLEQPNQWLVVNHWATWCDPCLEELPELRKLNASLPKDAMLLGISWDLFEGGSPPSALSRVGEFMEENALSYPNWLVVDEPEEFFSTLSIEWKRIPQTLVISPAGEVVKRINGLLTSAHLEEIQGLWAES